MCGSNSGPGVRAPGPRCVVKVVGVSGGGGGADEFVGGLDRGLAVEVEEFAVRCSAGRTSHPPQHGQPRPGRGPGSPEWSTGRSGQSGCCDWPHGRPGSRHPKRRTAVSPRGPTSPGGDRPAPPPGRGRPRSGPAAPHAGGHPHGPYGRCAAGARRRSPTPAGFPVPRSRFPTWRVPLVGCTRRRCGGCACPGPDSIRRHHGPRVAGPGLRFSCSLGAARSGELRSPGRLRWQLQGVP